MAEVGAARHRVQESARPPSGAVVVGQPGQQRAQPDGEARQLRRFPAGQLFELKPGDGHRGGREHVRPAQVAQVNEPHVRFLYGQYLSCAGPIAGVRVRKSKRHPAGSGCSRTPNNVIGSPSPAACTTVASSSSTTVVTPVPMTSNPSPSISTPVFSSGPIPRCSGSSATALSSRG